MWEKQRDNNNGNYWFSKIGSPSVLSGSVHFPYDTQHFQRKE